MKKSIVTLLAVCTFASPLVAFAFPFGGMIGQIVFCYNNAIYAAVGPPRGGPYIWTPSTQTYQFGPPSHTGQWLLGLAAPPYYCLVSIQPIIVWSGILITMMGSSGPAAPGLPGGGFGPATPNPTSFPTPTQNPVSAPPPQFTDVGIGHLVISEIYYKADALHGGKTEDEWMEIYNPTSASADVSRWTMRSSATSQTIPDGTSIPANGYLVFAGTTNVRTVWTIPPNAQVIAFPSSFTGFTDAGDHVFLQNSNGAQVDAVSYGTDTGAFSPSVPVVALTHSIIRRSFTQDTDKASDWVDTSAPTPGR